ncbi:MAG TPA: glycosyltransferase [Solirubrobacteraceae bacterium]|nr:glycosyltransferase [Solirubrobacteraceae bacterium]
MVIFLHNRYRTPGGEEQVVASLRRLVEEQIGEGAALLAADSAQIGRLRAARSLLAGGRVPPALLAELAAARAGGRVILHAHNLPPAFGWRTLAAARRQGARVVLHLHQYRIVCANGVCFTHGSDCTRCHGANTLPGVRLRCRGSLSEDIVYAAAIALWQRRLAGCADVVIVPSRFAARRLEELGAPLAFEALHILPPPIFDFAERSGAGEGGYVLLAARLSHEKGVDLAIDACASAGVELRIAGEGPLRRALEARAAKRAQSGAQVRFLGWVGAQELAALRAGAALAICPSRSENFPTAAAEAMAAGLPVIGTAVGGTPELLPAEWLAEREDVGALATLVERHFADRAAGELALARAREICSAEALAQRLARIYDQACE